VELPAQPELTDTPDPTCIISSRALTPERLLLGLSVGVVGLAVIAAHLLTALQ